MNLDWTHIAGSVGWSMYGYGCARLWDWRDRLKAARIAKLYQASAKLKDNTDKFLTRVSASASKDQFAEGYRGKVRSPVYAQSARESTQRFENEECERCRRHHHRDAPCDAF